MLAKLIKGALVTALVAYGTVSQAATVTYNLAYSNNAAGHISGDPLLVTDDIPNDGTVYATVTIDDEGAAGLINFEVATSTFWDGKEATNFGIQSFGFNLTGGATGLNAGDVIIPGTYFNWSATVGSTTLDGLGGFDVALTTQGQGGPDRQDPLTFSIDLGQDQSGTDSIFDYVADSIAGANGSFLFAVHIAGFNDQNPDGILSLGDLGYDIDSGPCDLGSDDPASNPNCNILTSVWVSNTTVVPVPAAVWLFGSGLLGLVGIARRKKTS